MVKKLLPIVMLAVLSGCSGGLSNASEDDQKEYILTQLNDYQGLIEIYRKKLSLQDNVDDRYHLSMLYNKIGDYNSSNIYLKPLVESNGDTKYSLLQAKNLIELGNESDARDILDNLISKDEANGELWNLQGIMLAQQGRYSDAMRSFEKARGLFYNEEIVINNIAMMEILQQDYVNARDNLLSLYVRKKYRSQTVYNLVYSLVKIGDYGSARKILVSEKMILSDADELISSLAKLSPREQVQLNVQNNSKWVKKDSQIDEKSGSHNESSLPVSVNKSLSEQHAANIAPAPAPAPAVASKQCDLAENQNDKVLPFKGKIANAKSIAILTSASITNGDRLALYSSYPINFMLLPKLYDNQIELELFSVQPLNSIFDSQLAIMNKRPDVKKIEFINKGDGNTILRIITARCIKSESIKRTTTTGKNKEKILIDFTYE
ncbi:tetratricopeptide repeat protein [Kluyvera sp. 142486]|uniref:tetratricopeptide repeat protein n=1 Tax=Kluyvera sp. 142486 TaxID=3390050 RepID=UPI00397EB2A6